MKTIKEIVEETVAYYSVNPQQRRSVQKDSLGRSVRCMYNGPDGKHCAVGRLLKPEVLQEIGDDSVLNSDAVIDLPCNLEEKEIENPVEIFLPEYQIKNFDFWSDLQNLHDGDNYWDEKGITEAGRKRADKIIEKYTEEEVTV